jgi:hypothetical protein
MKREWKKKLKELEREKKKQKKFLKKINEKNRRWPAIFCLNENIFIGVSYNTLKAKFGILQKQVTKDQWYPEISKFRSKEYEIDFKKFNKGDLVLCPKCGGKVDFRVWLSAKTPEFV